MSTPLASTTTEPRRSSRRQKYNKASIPAQSNTSNSETSPPRETTNATPTNSAPAKEINSKNQSSAPRKKSQRPKKQNDGNGSQSDRNPSHAHKSSQTNVLSPSKQTTPLKAAYAGPTFHSSPAASSLPMPSFYSRSLPTVTASPTLSANSQLDGQGHAESDTETSVPTKSEASLPNAREPSPLDFLFDAARKAKELPMNETPNHRAGRLSPFDDIPKSRSRTPGDPSTESVFPFELDGNGGRPPAIGPAIATPYKDRMEALRSPKGHSLTPPQNMDEKERKEKSEALKRLLINASPLKSPQKPDMNSYFPDQPSATQSVSPNLQRSPHRSGSNTPRSKIQHAPIPRHHIPNVPVSIQERQSSDPQFPRPNSSHLRREYQPDGHHSPAELDSDSGTPSRTRQGTQYNRQSIPAQPMNNFPGQPRYQPVTSPITSRTSHSAQKLEDDLRRVLKLDLTSSG
jgi:Proline-rich nuclear receptor coactivator motif